MGWQIGEQPKTRSSGRPKRGSQKNYKLAEVTIFGRKITAAETRERLRRIEIAEKLGLNDCCGR
jgi:hypothetical protein